MNQRKKPTGRPGSWAPVRPIGWWPALALVSAAVAGYGWARPVSHEVSAPRPYAATYHFDYTADLPPANVVYEQDTLSFGDPVFRNVVQTIDVSVDFSLDTPGVTVRDATLTTKVVVSSRDGWTRTLHAAGPTSFEGNRTAATVEVDFAAADALAKKVASAAGVSGDIEVAVIADVTATVTLRGNTGEERVSATAGSLVFDLGSRVATLRDYTAPTLADQVAGVTAEASGDTGAGPSATATKANQATQTMVAMVDSRLSEPSTLTLGKWDVTISDLRRAAVLTFLALALIALYNMIVLRLATRAGEAQFLRARYGATAFPLVDVADEVRRRAVWVGSFEALASAAANAETDILHQRIVGNDTYYVFDGPTVFAYLATKQPTAEASATEPEGS